MLQRYTLGNSMPQRYICLVFCQFVLTEAIPCLAIPCHKDTLLAIPCHGGIYVVSCVFVCLVCMQFHAWQFHATKIHSWQIHATEVSMSCLVFLFVLSVGNSMPGNSMPQRYTPGNSWQLHAIRSLYTNVRERERVRHIRSTCCYRSSGPRL